MPYRRTNGTTPPKLDFRAMADFVDALYYATDEEVQNARATTKEQMDFFARLFNSQALGDEETVKGRRFLQMHSFWEGLRALLAEADKVRSRRPSLEHNPERMSE